MRADREEFRAWVRAHHPDVGGDPEEFVAGLERRRRVAGRGPAAAEVSVFRTRGGLWLVIRWVRRRRHGHRYGRRVA